MSSRPAGWSAVDLIAHRLFIRSTNAVPRSLTAQQRMLGGQTTLGVFKDIGSPLFDVAFVWQQVQRIPARPQDPRAQQWRNGTAHLPTPGVMPTAALVRTQAGDCFVASLLAMTVKPDSGVCDRGS